MSLHGVYRRVPQARKCAASNILWPVRALPGPVRSSMLTCLNPLLYTVKLYRIIVLKKIYKFIKLQQPSWVKFFYRHSGSSCSWYLIITRCSGEKKAFALIKSLPFVRYHQQTKTAWKQNIANHRWSFPPVSPLKQFSDGNCIWQAVPHVINTKSKKNWIWVLSCSVFSGSLDNVFFSVMMLMLFRLMAAVLTSQVEAGISDIGTHDM